MLSNCLAIYTLFYEVANLVTNFNYIDTESWLNTAETLSNLKKKSSVASDDVDDEIQECAENQEENMKEEEEHKHGIHKSLKMDELSSNYSATFDACITDVAKRAKLTEKEFEQLVSDTSMAFFLQVLVMFIIYCVMPDKDYVEPTAIQMGLRLCMCSLYHFSILQDVASAMKRLKFLAQNPEQFPHKNLFTAFAVTQFQIMGAVVNEMVTMKFLTRQEDLFDIVMNYVAFEAINNIDNMMRAVSKNSAFKKLSDLKEYVYVRDSAKGTGDYQNLKPNTFSEP